MANAICDTSPLQYLHQIDPLDILPRLVGRILVPPADLDELSAGRSYGLSLPDPQTLDWVDVKASSSEAALALVTHLGPGEAAVLALALEQLAPAPARRSASCIDREHEPEAPPRGRFAGHQRRDRLPDVDDAR